MNITVERFFSKKGYIYKSNSDIMVSANYTMGLLLSKICVFNSNSKEILYTFRQNDVLLKLLLNVNKIFYNRTFYSRTFYELTSTPKYILYNNGIVIGNSEEYNNHKLDINIHGNLLTISIVKSDRKNNIIYVTEKNEDILIIKKDKLRYGKKNIYKIVNDNWSYDEALMLLLVAFCDIVFFPERMMWSAIEYNIC